MEGVEDGEKKAKKMNEMAGVRLTGFARNLLSEGLALPSVSSCGEPANLRGSAVIGEQNTQAEAIGSLLGCGSSHVDCAETEGGGDAIKT